MKDKEIENEESVITTLKTGHYKLQKKSLNHIFTGSKLFSELNLNFWKSLKLKDVLNWDFEKKNDFFNRVENLSPYLIQAEELKSVKKILENLLWYPSPIKEKSNGIEISIHEYTQLNLTIEARKKFDRIFSLHLNMLSDLEEIRSLYKKLFQLGINQINDLLLQVNAINTSVAKQKREKQDD